MRWRRSETRTGSPGCSELADAEPAGSAVGRAGRGDQDRDPAGLQGRHASPTSPSVTASRLVDTLRRVHARGGQKKVDFYLRLRALGIFPADAPHTIRAFGQAPGG